MTQWKQIPGFPDYQISSDGSVRSLDRFRKTSNDQVRFYKGKKIKTNSKNQYGHRKAFLRNPMGEVKVFYVHYLVAQAFLGPRPVGYEVAHRDGDPENNQFSNLRYDTPQGNHGDKESHGTLLRGEEHPSAKLTEDMVSKVRRGLREGVLQKDLAQEMRVCRSTIGAISVGRSWTNPQKITITGVPA